MASSSSGYHRWEGSGCSSSSSINLQEAKSKGVLGLKCVKTEALLSLLERSSKSTDTDVEMEMEMEMGRRKRRNKDINHVGSRYQPMSEKLKASNFPISSISVGAWKRVSRKEGELTAKLYFAKKKLVWEFLDGNLKSKMEVSWSDIIAINAIIPPNQHGVLQIELGNPPLFFRELEPQPRKHTNWQQATDFTDGQAPLHRRHFASFPPGALDPHYEKLLQHDRNLCELSKKPFPSLESPYFNASLPPFHITPALQLQQQQQWTTTFHDHHQYESSQGQQQQQQLQLQYYPTSSMHNMAASPLDDLNPVINMSMTTHQGNQLMNYVQTEAAGHNEASMNYIDEMAARNMWMADQTTFLDSSLVDMHQHQQQQWGCSSSCAYDDGSLGPPLPPLDENLSYHPTVPAGYGYGYGGMGMGMTASDLQEVLNVRANDTPRWLLPYVIKPITKEYSPGFDVMDYISSLHLYAAPPPSTSSPTNIQQSQPQQQQHNNNINIPYF